MRSLTILALSTLCLAASACKPEEIRSVSAIPLLKEHPERFECNTVGTRPTINPEFKIDWTKVGSISDAKREFENYRNVQHGREKVVADYVLALESVNSLCAINMGWQRDFYKGLETPPQP